MKSAAELISEAFARMTTEERKAFEERRRKAIIRLIEKLNNKPDNGAIYFAPFII